EPLKPRAKNQKNWSKNKEKKLLKQQSKSSRGDRENEEDKPNPGKDEKDEKDDATTDKDQPHNRRRVQVIFSRQCTSSDEESCDEPKDLRGRLNLLIVKSAAPPTDNIDLRNRLKRKTINAHPHSLDATDLRRSLEESKVRNVDSVDDSKTR